MLDSPFINLSLVLILYLPYFQDPEKSLKFTLQLEIWALPQNRSMCSHIDGLAWKESKVRRTRRSNSKPKDVACLSHCLGPDTDTRLLILMDNRWQELVVLYPPRGHFYCLRDPHPILLKFNSRKDSLLSNLLDFLDFWSLCAKCSVALWSDWKKSEINI